MSVVAATARNVIGDRKVVHSTSWRRDRAAVVLCFVAVIDATQVGAMATVEVGRAELARGDAAAAAGRDRYRTGRRAWTATPRLARQRRSGGGRTWRG